MDTDKVLKDFSLTKPSVQVLRCLHEALARLPKKARILEIGVGDGSVSNWLYDQGYAVTAADMSSHCLAHLRPEIPRHVLDIETGKFPFDAHAFDAIFLFEVLEHVRDPEGILRSLRTYLAPQGIIAATTPNINWWPFRLKFLLGSCPEDFHTTNHVQFWNLSRFNALFVQSGFRVVRQAASIGFLNIIPFVKKTPYIEKHGKYIFWGTSRPHSVLGYDQSIIATPV